MKQLKRCSPPRTMFLFQSLKGREGRTALNLTAAITVSVNTGHSRSWFSHSELDLHFGNRTEVPVRGKLGFLF